MVAVVNTVTTQEKGSGFESPGTFLHVLPMTVWYSLHNSASFHSPKTHILGELNWMTLCVSVCLFVYKSCNELDSLRLHFYVAQLLIQIFDIEWLLDRNRVIPVVHHRILLHWKPHDKPTYLSPLKGVWKQCGGFSKRSHSKTWKRNCGKDFNCKPVCANPCQY